MLHKITIDIPQDKSLEMELDCSIAPKTVKAILDNLPISVPIHVWGEELYTDPIHVKVPEENAKPLVNLLDVAYWPRGRQSASSLARPLLEIKARSGHTLL